MTSRTVHARGFVQNYRVGAVDAVAPDTCAGGVGWAFRALAVGDSVSAEVGGVTSGVGETVAVGSPGVGAVVGSPGVGATGGGVGSATVVVRTGAVGQVVVGIIDGDTDATGGDASVGSAARGAVQTDGRGAVVGARLAGGVGGSMTADGDAVVGAWLAGGVGGSMTGDGGGAVVGAWLAGEVGGSVTVGDGAAVSTAPVGATEGGSVYSGVSDARSTVGVTVDGGRRVGSPVSQPTVATGSCPVRTPGTVEPEFNDAWTTNTPPITAAATPTGSTARSVRRRRLSRSTTCRVVVSECS
ncbi:hypothetical protein ABLG96_00730 [Nakamurella sp. A5-74]|uniref:Uncharacterized protein n=1 Tax=Nakamurella sp. A5-74 TaxID=3158264 RepID=A0AAU8DR04_9ACTN